jgi:hypothetical protein
MVVTKLHRITRLRMNHLVEIYILNTQNHDAAGSMRPFG